MSEQSRELVADLREVGLSRDELVSRARQAAARIEYLERERAAMNECVYEILAWDTFDEDAPVGKSKRLRAALNQAAVIISRTPAPKTSEQ